MVFLIIAFYEVKDFVYSLLKRQVRVIDIYSIFCRHQRSSVSVFVVSVSFFNFLLQFV